MRLPMHVGDDRNEDAAQGNHEQGRRTFHGFQERETRHKERRPEHHQGQDLGERRDKGRILVASSHRHKRWSSSSRLRARHQKGQGVLPPVVGGRAKGIRNEGHAGTADYPGGASKEEEKRARVSERAMVHAKESRDADVPRDGGPT